MGQAVSMRKKIIAVSGFSLGCLFVAQSFAAAAPAASAISAALNLLAKADQYIQRMNIPLSRRSVAAARTALLPAIANPRQTDIRAFIALGRVGLYTGDQSDMAYALAGIMRVDPNNQTSAGEKKWVADLKRQVAPSLLKSVMAQRHQFVIHWLAASKGSVADEMLVGEDYFKGTGTPVNPPASLQYTHAAAVAGNSIAMANMGFFYLYGKGVKADYNRGRYWYKKSAMDGYADAMFQLGMLDYGRITGGTTPFGIQTGPIQRDYSGAIKWWKLAAAKGDGRSMDCLGQLYLSGTGVKRDYSKALESFKKAAHLGVLSGYEHLGLMYQQGLGVKVDMTAAAKLYAMAAARGDSNSMLRLALLYMYGKGVKQNNKMALHLEHQAAALGNPHAMYNLGYMYAHGLCVPVSRRLAFIWFTQAKKAGDPAAQAALYKLLHIHPGGF